ncbi:HaeII restriction endonuclease, partial [Haemophilus influenzae]|jgi:hypothetical protein
MNDI